MFRRMSVEEFSPSERTHIPVLLEECSELFAPALQGESPILVDFTLGLGGHTEAFLETFDRLKIIGIDRDLNALTYAKKRLERFGSRMMFANRAYDEFEQVLTEHNVQSIDAAFFDLGLSSLQIDDTRRGFSYSKDAPLDMRMDEGLKVCAADIVNTYAEEDLVRIFRDYGEERYAPKYARYIVQQREREPFTRSSQLVDLIARVTPRTASRSGHPAKRVFQALRIEVNDELSILERALPIACDALKVGGRIVVESYHSLEDRIVKRFLQKQASSSAPLGLPIEAEAHKPQFSLLTRGAMTSSESEKHINRRASSVRLRAAQRIRRLT